MLEKALKHTLFFLLLSTALITHAAEEEVPISCGTEAAMDAYYKYSPSAALEEQAGLGNTDSSSNNTPAQSGPGTPTYRIPVVFHVYGNTFNGRAVTYEIIRDGLRMVNEDFQGLTADWNTIVPPFDNVKQALDIEFMLAKNDPEGNPTTGIVWHPVKWGYGNWGHNSQVAADAWDNTRYMNVYIQNDLYGNGVTNNSGVAWYPSSSMTNANTARVVYNGAYIGNNTSVNFRSVLTHEFGHWLNLPHTFEAGCSASNEPLCSSTGDFSCDTPQVDNSSIDRAGELNCLGQETNWQNFMAYSSQYANFTKDQVTRMKAALNHAARYSLWQADNLNNTGVFIPQAPALTLSSTLEEDKLTDNGTIIGNVRIRSIEGASFSASSGNWIEGYHYTITGLPRGLTATITAQNDKYAILTLSGQAGKSHKHGYFFHHHRCKKKHNTADSFDFTLSVLDSGLVGGTASLVNPSNTIHVPLSTVRKLFRKIDNISAADKENNWYAVDVYPWTKRLTIRSSANNGDADIFVRYQQIPYDNTQADYLECASATGTSNEECVIENPPVGRWYVLLHAWAGFEQLTLEAAREYGKGSNGTALINGQPLNISQNISKTQDRFYIDVPKGATELTIRLTGGAGDADLYTRFGAGATTSVWDCRSWNIGAINNETCTHPNPQKGRWHIMVFAWEPYTGADLTATIVGGNTADDDDDDDDDD